MQNLFSMLGLVGKRLRHNLGLSASALIGIVAILMMAVCVPIFSDAVSADVLHRELINNRAGTQRQLFSLRYVYSEKAPESQLDLEKSLAISRLFQDQFPAQLGLPVDQVVMDIRTDGMIVTDRTGRWPEGKTSPMGQWSFAVQDMLPEHANVVEGAWPEADVSGESAIEVAVPVSMADEMLLKIGDHFLLDSLEVVVVGFWESKDTNDRIWFNTPDSEYNRTVWVPSETYLARVKPATSLPVAEVSWYVIIKDQNLQFQRASQYLRGLMRINADLKRTVEGIQNTYSPMEALSAYQKRADTLATLFYVVGSPMLVLALIFISLTARISVQQYENETAILRARGTSRAQVMLLNLTETTLLILLSLPAAVGVGWLAANLMNQTISFLQFTNRSVFPITLDSLNFLILAVAGGVIVIARFAPILKGSKITVLRVKQEQSRGSPRPFWERFYLDFFLLIPGAYAFFVLKGWSQPAQLLSQLQLSEGQQFRDPLLFVAPALLSIALGMICVRLIPWIVRLLAAIANHLPGVWAYLSLQQIARRSQDHSNALLLIIISLSVSIFTVSAARTLDRWLYDSEYYKVGADLAVEEFINLSSGSFSGAEESGSGDSARLVESFLTIEEHKAIPGVVHAARMGKYDAKYSFGSGEKDCQVIGIDRLDFTLTAYFRDDFAKQDLGSLMNALGSDLDGVLLPTSLMDKNGIVIGDQLSVAINAGTASYDRTLRVVGAYDYFPTVFPKDKPALIMNLESIFNYPEDVEGYQMLLKLDQNTDIPTLISTIGEKIGNNQALVNIKGDALDAVIAGQDQPERMGLFGILNVGFFATGLMPGIGFLIYSYASLRRRFIQLGILQAIGLSAKQLIASLVSEQVILMGLAILAGAGIGLASSLMFVPFLQTGTTPGAPVPPFQVIIGWAEAGWLSLGFGLILSLTMIGTIMYLARLKVFQAVKLGETL